MPQNQESISVEDSPGRGIWSEIGSALAGHPRDYTRGSIGRAVFLLAIPMVLEMSMQSIFAVVDVFFVGRLGPEAVAVVGITDALLTLVFAVALGLSMATTAMVARRIGEGKSEAAGMAAGQSLLLGILFSIIAGVPGYLFATELLQLVGAPPEVVESGSTFTGLMLGGSATVMLLFLINAIFRGAGDAAIAMRALWLANLVNIILDPLLIFGYAGFPELGLEGAAVATIIGRGIGVVYQILRLTRGRGMVTVKVHHIRFNWDISRRLLRIAWVGILQFLIGTASWLGVIRILAIFGGDAVAGYTIAVRIIIFTLLPSWGMGNAAATLVGQNLGARKPHRAARCVWLTGFSNMVFLGIVAVTFIVFAQPLVSLFSDDAGVKALAVSCLVIVSCSYLFLAFGMVTVQAFNGAGDTWTPTWINLFCYWILELPLAYLLSVPGGWGPSGVFVAISVAQGALAVVGVWQFRKGHWKSRAI